MEQLKKYLIENQIKFGNVNYCENPAIRVHFHNVTAELKQAAIEAGLDIDEYGAYYYFIEQ